MEDRDLPLHDEANAREKWRGDETIEGDEQGAPASGVDDAAAGDHHDRATPRLDLRPPD